MSTHIAIKGANGVIAGIPFTDGAAIVPSLGTNARKYFEHVGASVTDGVTEIVGTKLEDLGVDELRDLAKDAGLDLPAKAKKAELIEALEAAPAPVLTAATSDATPTSQEG